MIKNTQGKAFTFSISVLVIAVLASVVLLMTTFAQGAPPSVPASAGPYDTPTPTVTGAPTTTPTPTEISFTPTPTPTPTQSICEAFGKKDCNVDEDCADGEVCRSIFDPGPVIPCCLLPLPTPTPTPPTCSTFGLTACHTDEECPSTQFQLCEPFAAPTGENLLCCQPNPNAICHKTKPGTPTPLWNILVVPDSALAPHFSHGDFRIGGIPEGEITHCKDDNFCPLDAGDVINNNKDCDIRIHADDKSCACDCEVKPASGGPPETRTCLSNCRKSSCDYNIAKETLSVPCGFKTFPQCKCRIDITRAPTHGDPNPPTRYREAPCNDIAVDCGGKTCPLKLGEIQEIGCSDTGGVCECRVLVPGILGDIVARVCV